MTPITLVALAMSIAAMGFAWDRVTISRLLMLILILITHVTTTLYYYYYSQTAVSDAWGYYFSSHLWSGQPFSIGTMAVVKLVLLLKTRLGATYLDCFLLFAGVGFAGLMIMVRVFDEIETKVQVSERRGYLGLLFLPSVNFWTSAIGKDAPLFFAITLCVWAMLRLRTRFIWFGISLGIMVAFRAHIALMAATSLAAAAFFEGTVSTGRKLGLLAIAILGVWITIGAVQQSLKVDVTSATSIGSFLEKQNNIYATVAGTTSLGSASFVVRAFSLFFRPFFFDANGVMGIVASAENVGVAAAVLYVVWHWRDLALLVRRVFFIRFVLLFAFVLLFSLCLVYYNVGLGLRQRVMAYPMIFSMLIALWSSRRKQAVPPHPQARPALLVRRNATSPLPDL